MLSDDLKQLYALKAEVLAAAGHPLRLAVIDFLLDGEQCVCDIAEHLGARRSNVSRHLAVLTRAGVLTCRKEGLRMLYSLTTPCIAEMTRCVTAVLRRRVRENRAVLKALR